MRTATSEEDRGAREGPAAAAAADGAEEAEEAEEEEAEEAEAEAAAAAMLIESATPSGTRRRQGRATHLSKTLSWTERRFADVTSQKQKLGLELCCT